MLQRTLFRARPLPFPSSIRCTRPIYPSPVLTQRLGRFYSESKSESAAEGEAAAAAATEASPKDTPTSSTTSPPKEPPADLAKQLEAKETQIRTLDDRLKRSVADYRNLQTQTKREIQSARDFALQKFAKDLVDTVDNLDLALATVPESKLNSTSDPPSKDLKNLHSGIKMTADVLLQTLKRHGVEKYDPAAKGEKFDPNVMEATFQAPQEGKEDGTVFYTQQTGFRLNGRVLRAAKVGVVKNT
ncbi:GrpE-domain-containing protein [Piedraia hortae CBS 480.64]|uniref:GrpE protein homolog n=1 Tax=Piedraia hortae CBS 480.64 TaxID=1314780 RepID=A0A6A7C1T8_9PEZI|nr:GrpE-domain-containing protein [Piedraia hortae CBS 480.64]